jgi:hypothetical protein
MTQKRSGEIPAWEAALFEFLNFFESASGALLPRKNRSGFFTGLEWSEKNWSRSKTDLRGAELDWLPCGERWDSSVLERSNLILMKTDFLGIRLFCLKFDDPSLSKTEDLLFFDCSALSRTILGCHSSVCKKLRNERLDLRVEEHWNPKPNHQLQTEEESPQK